MGKNVLKVTCMDRRLGHAIDEQGDRSEKDNIIVLRNAGANLGGIEGSMKYVIEKNRINDIEVFTHTDCGACKVVYNASNHNIEVSSEVDKILVRPFTNTGMSFANPGEVENENIVLQEDALRRFTARGIETHVNCIDLKKLDIPKEHGESVLVIGKPYSGRYEDLASELKLDLWSMYCLNTESIIEVMPDIEVAAMNLGIKRFIIVATKPEEYRWANDEEKRLRLMPFMRNAEKNEMIDASVVKL